MGFSRALACLPVLAFATAAQAGPGKLPDSYFDGMPITDPNWKPELTGVGHEPDAVAALNSPTVLFVNFDAENINCGCGNNSLNDCSSIYCGPFVPYDGSDSDRASVIQATRADVVDFGVVVVGERPPAGNPYAMVFVGTPPGGPPGQVGGVAPFIDCGNTNPNITSFAFLVDGSSNLLATVIHQEAAHTWGLEHVNNTKDNLHPVAGNTIDPKYTDECAQVVSNTDLTPDNNADCNAVHTMFCASNQQNSYREMLALFGPPIPDLTAPTVVIESPTEGQILDYDEDFDLVFTLDDDRRPQILDVTVLVDGVEAADAVLINTTAKFPVNAGDPPNGHGFADGEHTIRIEITDESGNPAADEVTFTIVNAPSPVGGDETGDPGTAGDDSGGADDGPAQDDGDDDGNGSADGTSGPPADDEAGKGGCACRTGSGTPSWAWLIVGVVAGVRRRRRVA